MPGMSGKGEQLGRALTLQAVKAHGCEGAQLSTAGREEPKELLFSGAEPRTRP